MAANFFGVLVCLDFPAHLFARPSSLRRDQLRKKTVTNNGLGDSSYAINDSGQVAWGGRVDGVEQIFLCRDGRNTQITANTPKSGGIASLQVNNLGQIAWSQQDYDSTGSNSNTNVYLYDGSSYQQLNDNHGEWDWQSLAPSLNNAGQVAWIQTYQNANEDWEVYLFTGSGLPTQLSDGTGRSWPPRLNDSGWVTWSGDRRKLDDWDTRVYLYSGALPAPPIAYRPGEGCTDPLINNQGQVAWKNIDADANYNLYLWNGTSTRITNLGTTNFDSLSPFALNNAGQIIWPWSKDLGVYQVYLYSGGAISQLTHDAFDHYNCRLRENGWIAWTQETFDVLPQIYVYRQGSATLIAQGTIGPPRLNSRGQVAWADGETIFLASPAPAPPAVISLLLLN